MFALNILYMVPFFSFLFLSLNQGLVAMNNSCLPMQDWLTEYELYLMTGWVI